MWEKIGLTLMGLGLVCSISAIFFASILMPGLALAGAGVLTYGISTAASMK